MTASHDRMVWIDISKGIGIALVVLAHVFLHSSSAWAALLARTIFLFHMPLFFLLAGVTLKSEPLRPFTLRKTATLLLPYLFYLALLGLPALAVSCTMASLPSLGIDTCTILPIELALGGSSLGGIFGTFWFIPGLLLALLLAQTILRLSTPQRLCAIPLLLLAAYALPHLLPRSTALLALGVAPMAALLVLTGYWLKQTGLWQSPAALPLALSASALTILAHVPIDMKAGQYGIPLLSMAGAIALSILLMRTSHHLARYPFSGTTLASMGRKSLTILYLHQAIHLSLRQLGLSNDALLFTLALAIPLLLDRPAHHLINACRPAFLHHLSRKSSLV